MPMALAWGCTSSLLPVHVPVLLLAFVMHFRMVFWATQSSRPLGHLSSSPASSSCTFHGTGCLGCPPSTPLCPLAGWPRWRYPQGQMLVCQAVYLAVQADLLLHSSAECTSFSFLVQVSSPYFYLEIFPKINPKYINVSTWKKNS